MAAKFESIASNVGVGSTILVIPKPSGLIIGEAMVGIVAHHFFNEPTQLPPGWTLVQDFVHPQGADKTTLCFKIADSADVAASDFTWARGGTGASVVFVGSILRVSGIEPSGLINIHAFATDSTFATQVVTPTVTTTVNGALLLRVAQGFSTLVGVGIISATIGSGAYTERLDIRDRGSKEFGLAVYTIDVNQPTAGPTGTETITIINQGDNPGVTGLTVAIAPLIVIPINQADIETRRQALMSKGRRLMVIVSKPGVTDPDAPVYLVKDPDAGTSVGAKPPQSAADAQGFANDGWKIYSFNDVGTAYNL